MWMGISATSLMQIKDNINTNTTYNLTKDGSTITLSGSDGSIVSITDSNTIYSNATTSAAGLMSAADKSKLNSIATGANKIVVDSSFVADSTNPVQSKVIKTALDGKSNTGHKHVKADITDFPTSMPASDVYTWAKAASKPSYTIGEVSGNLAASRISGTISAANLPSYVDDVLEYASLSKFPTTGESGKIYTALDTNKIYRWSGSAYVVISETVALGTTHSSAGYGDESRAAYNHSTKTSGNPHHVTKTDVGLGNVDNTADSAKSVKYATSAGSVAWSNVSGKPSSMPASDVYSWAKQPSKPSYTASEVGAAPASHSHSYLPLSGGTMTGKINRGAGGNWISARNNVVAFGTTANSLSYNPVVGQKTTKGAWTVGNLAGDERLVFSYDTDTNFNAGNNSNNTTYLPIGNSSQEIITSTTIGSQSVNHANTAGSVAWSNVSGRPSSMPASDVYAWAKASSKPSYSWSEISGRPTIPSVGNGTVTITQNGATKGTFTLNQSGNATIALTDNNTVYSLPAATSSALGGVKVGSNITNSSGTISLTKANVTAALGYTPPTSDTNTWRPEEVIISSTQPSASTCKLWIKI
uniref:Peptidase n=1 Tax=Siphoviridae sp. ctnPP24 TaxID=2825662 RepID=A0A8S5TYN2_9CAUD|nr:MAG TPA: Peptidase [Siphoviridae sp. ctnPP24]